MTQSLQRKLFEIMANMAKISMNYKTGACLQAQYQKMFTMDSRCTFKVHFECWEYKCSSSNYCRFIVIPYFSSITAVTEVQITACVAQHWVDTDTNEANLKRVIDCYTCLHEARQLRQNTVFLTQFQDIYSSDAN